MSVHTPQPGRAAAATAANKEAVMGQPIPTQHPAVVLRSHYTHVRILLAIAMIAVVSLAVAVVILAGNDGARPSATSAPDRSESRVPSHASDAAQSGADAHYSVQPQTGSKVPVPDGTEPAAGFRGGDHPVDTTDRTDAAQAGNDPRHADMHASTVKKPTFPPADFRGGGNPDRPSRHERGAAV
jgi:hypothetical protein